MEKGIVEQDIQELDDIINNEDSKTRHFTADEMERLAHRLGQRAEQSNVGPAGDLEFLSEHIIRLSEQEAIDILVNAIEYHTDDPNFSQETMQKMKLLVLGPKSGGLVYSDPSLYSFDLKAEAALIKYHSPYPEVRAVCDPSDDPDIPVETIRAYVLGMCFMAGATVVNTFFSPRQPSISISAVVLQLLIAPCGIFCAKVLPDWGFSFRGRRISLNPGPWTFKEQNFATIIFSVAHGPGGNYYIYIVQRLPQYLGHSWVTFGYEILLAISVQCFGLGFAGIFRRFVIYPVRALWPKVLPTLAMNKALLIPSRHENINGWTISRYKFFMLCFIGMFFYFWIPNSLFSALHSFNWMTWIAPNNFNVGMITGFYGGMGFNPISTFDWNVSGTGSLITPFFSTMQQYVARVLSGLIIIGMYWGNMYWSAYMPINSNESFKNNGSIYAVGEILTNNIVDLDKYKAYGPPYFSGANVFGQGAWFAWYPMSLIFVVLTNWKGMSKAFKGVYRGIVHREAAFDTEDDPHTKMMRHYKEVPDWWFLVILLASLVLGIIALKVYPTATPVWTLFAVMGISFVFLLPTSIMLAVANVGVGFDVLFHMLGGIWFGGNPEGLLICGAYGQTFNSQTENYMSSQKLGHYAKLPPRALFRGQVASIVINCFIFVGFLNWMITHFQKDSLCTWENPQHFVCTDAVLVYASAVEYGAFGVRNMFALYPILPWCFLIGALIGLLFGVSYVYGSTVRDWCRRKMSEKSFDIVDNRLFYYLTYVKNYFNPAFFWAGALNWTGGNNLSYATTGLYISIFFMYYVRRRYTAWWEKYNYLIECGFDVGVAISGIIQTLAFAFSNTSISWWGNNVSQAGVDFQSYNQNSTLLPLPESGYFGIPPDKYPMHF